jgi:pyrroloquinoline quinone (PQQ) biosynthesis protein C
MSVRIIRACSEELIADHEHGGGRPHWEILEDLGVRIGLRRRQLREAKPLPSTELAWAAWEGLSDGELEFFELHTQADIEHSDTGWRAVEKFSKKLRMEDAAVAACGRNLHVWEHYLNGIAAGGDRNG